MAFTAIAAVAAATTAGVEVHNTQEQSRQAKDASRDQENAGLKQQHALMDEQAQSDAERDAVMTRARQKAVASIGTTSNYGGTLKTSPLGIPSAPIVSNKSLLGL